MNKKGFTLVEIIVCIVIVVAVGTISFFGIRTITKNIRVNKLKDIEDEILTAARIYMETNNKTYEQLYKENNSVILPLNVLVNEGLLDLTNTDLKISDIEKEYVITALASTNSNNEDCVNITEGSWNLSSSAPIYICTNTSTGSTNLSIINPSSVTNATKIRNEVFVYGGPNPNNYIKLKGKDRVYRIYYVDTDDSLVLISEKGFDNTFNGKTMNLCGIPVLGTINSNGAVAGSQYVGYFYNNLNGITRFDYLGYKYFFEYNLNENCSADNEKDNKQKLIDIYDLLNTTDFSLFNTTFTSYTAINLWQYSFLRAFFRQYDVNRHLYRNDGFTDNRSSYGEFYGFKLHLKACMQITSGTGNYANPFILEDKC